VDCTVTALDETAERAAPEVTMPVICEADLLRVRSALRAKAELAGLGLTATTKLVTAGSELARNIIKYAGGTDGSMSVQLRTDETPAAVRAVFCDHGPGIADLAAAMHDGYSTAGSLGLGLPGSRRLVDEFSIESAPGQGTTVVIALWIR
jgi:serine/threonine-protein kinase RsbT